MRDILIFGDSNALLFRDLHKCQGYEHWQPDESNPVETSTVFIPQTNVLAGEWPRLVRFGWISTEPDVRRVEVFAFIAASAGGLRKLASTGGEIRRILKERGDSAYHAAFFFGQGDLDFVLFHALGREPIDVYEFMRERAERYINFIRDHAGPGAAITILGIHPVTIADENLIEFFRRYRLELPRFPESRIEAIAQICPSFLLESRLGYRGYFAGQLRSLCASHNYCYADVSAEVSRDGLVRPEYACSDPLDVHVSLPQVLPFWLEKLSWLGRAVESLPVSPDSKTMAAH